MDGILTLFLFFFISIYITTPIARKTSNYDNYVMEVYQKEVSSHLYMMLQQNNDGEYVVIEVKDYTERLDSSHFQKIYPVYNIDQVKCDDYIRYLNYYYTVYLTGDTSRVELPNVESINVNDYFSPDSSIKIDGKLPSEIYTARYFNTKVMGLSPEGEENTSPYYEYPVKDNVVDYDGLPVVKTGVNESDVKKDLREKAYSATKAFFFSDYISSRQSSIKSIQLWSEIPVYVVLVLVLYLMIPLLTKNGATLGKLSLGIGVVSNTGYQAKKRQILFRSIVFIVEITFSLFIVGYGLTSLATLLVGCVIMMVVALITKKNQAPHDLAAMTMEIDMKKSVFFENASEEDRYHKRVQNNIEELNKYEPENPNLIQVGGEIIDPDLKKKIDEKNKNQNKKK